MLSAKDARTITDEYNSRKTIGHVIERIRVAASAGLNYVEVSLTLTRDDLEVIRSLGYRIRQSEVNNVYAFYTTTTIEW